MINFMGAVQVFEQPTIMVFVYEPVKRDDTSPLCEHCIRRANWVGRPLHDGGAGELWPAFCQEHMNDEWRGRTSRTSRLPSRSMPSGYYAMFLAVPGQES